MKHVVTDKEMAEISDRIEGAIADALTVVYDDLALRFGENQVTTEELFDAGEVGHGELFDMRELAIKLFAGMGLEIECNGKGF